MITKDITMRNAASVWDFVRVFFLYHKAFPREEKKPFSRIISKWRAGQTDAWMFFKGGRFAGFAFTLNGSDLIMLDYLAVSKRMQRQGIGTAALMRLLEVYRGKRFFLEIESEYEDGPDRQSRRDRKRFYMQCGLKPLNVMADVYGVKMELMGLNMRMDFNEYLAFYRDTYRPVSVNYIKKLPHPCGEGGYSV